MVFKKKIFLFLGLMLIILVVIILGLEQDKHWRKNSLTASKEFARIIFNDKVEVKAEILRTSAEKIKGLSGRKNLLPQEGALFVYREPGFYKFWMKEMNFPLDIIWLMPEESQKEVFRIVDITSNVSPSSFPQTFSSRVPSQYVLELRAGFVLENDLKVGSTIKIKGL